MSRDIQMPIPLDDIDVPEGRREIVAASVKRLADSIEQVGLRHPITVRRKGDRYVLVAGRHRMEACRKLGREHVPATIVSMTKDEARLWEIAENLHRAELTTIQKAECIEEWRQLSAVLHGATPSTREAASQLGVNEATVSRASAIASIEPEAKQAANEVGLTGVRELVEVARAEPSRQAAVVHELAERRAAGIDRDVKDRAAHAVAELIAEHVPGSAWDALKANLYAAGAANIANAFTNITGESIMDRRFGA